MNTVYVLAWGNGNVDVFANAEDAIAVYAADCAAARDEGEMATFVAEDGQEMPVKDAQEYIAATWSEAAKALIPAPVLSNVVNTEKMAKPEIEAAIRAHGATIVTDNVGEPWYASMFLSQIGEVGGPMGEYFIYTDAEFAHEVSLAAEEIYERIKAEN